MSLFIDPSWKPLLERSGLAGFEQAWTYEAAWVEAPNDYRGGWSGVGRVTLMDEAGEVGVYLKRQQNHARRTWRHPWTGEPTFTREFRIIRHLQRHGVGTPQPVLFGERRLQGALQAVLLTAELAGFRPLDELGAVGWPLARQRALLRAVARTVRGMHDAGIQHRSLYAKHLFVRAGGDGFEVAVIDFEKSRRNLWPVLPAFYDLVTLNYRTAGWSRSSRLYFFKQYWDAGKLTRWQKWLCRLIRRRSQEKSERNDT